MLNSKVFAMVLLVSVPAQADWFCQEASSQKTGSWITTCGKATAKTEAQARIDAREKAIEEFKRVCNISKDCRDFDFSMKPMRTECSTDGSSVTCVRALEFEILDVERTTIDPDVITVEEQIKDHNQQIKELEILVAKAKESKTVRRELAMVKQDLNNETGEGKTLYTSDSFQNSIKFDLKFWDTKLTNDSDSATFSRPHMNVVLCRGWVFKVESVLAGVRPRTKLTKIR